MFSNVFSFSINRYIYRIDTCLMSIYEKYIFANISNALRLVPDDAVQSGKYYSFFLGNTQPNLFVLN